MHARISPGILSKNVSVRAALQVRISGNTVRATSGSLMLSLHTTAARGMQARLSCPVWPYRWPCTRAARLVSTCATRCERHLLTEAGVAGKVA
jgi:hypothetical protein